MSSSTRLQLEAQAARGGLADTLGQLREGMAPSALSAEALALAKDTGLSVVKSLSEQVRANPVPALLIGAGIVMLMTRTTGGDIASVAGAALKTAATTGADAARSAAGAAGDAVKSAAVAAGDVARDGVNRATDALGEKAANLREHADAHQGTITGAYDSARERVQDAVDQGRQGLHDRQDQAKAVLSDTQQSVARLIEEQPILMAALGVALGAAIGAALPLSRQEQEMLGKTGASAVAAGRGALSGAADMLRKEADRAGLSDKVGEMADKLVEGATQGAARR